MSILETALLNIENLTGTAIVALKKLWALPVSAYYPTGAKSIYSTDDAYKMGYPATPNYVGKELITGIYSSRFASDTTIDTYTSDEPKLITVDCPIVKDAKIVISYGTRTLAFRVSKIQKIHGRHDAIIQVMYLVPQ